MFGLTLGEKGFVSVGFLQGGVLVSVEVLLSGRSSCCFVENEGQEEGGSTENEGLHFRYHFLSPNSSFRSVFGCVFLVHSALIYFYFVK